MNPLPLQAPFPWNPHLDKLLLLPLQENFQVPAAIRLISLPFPLSLPTAPPRHGSVFDAWEIPEGQVAQRPSPLAYQCFLLHDLRQAAAGERLRAPEQQQVGGPREIPPRLSPPSRSSQDSTRASHHLALVTILENKVGLNIPSGKAWSVLAARGDIQPAFPAASITAAGRLRLFPPTGFPVRPQPW